MIITFKKLISEKIICLESDAKNLLLLAANPSSHRKDFTYYGSRGTSFCRHCHGRLLSKSLRTPILNFTPPRRPSITIILSFFSFSLTWHFVGSAGQCDKASVYDCEVASSIIAKVCWLLPNDLKTTML